MSSSSSFFFRLPAAPLTGDDVGVTFSFLTLFRDGVADARLALAGLTSDFFSFFTTTVAATTGFVLLDFRCAAAAA